MPPITTIPSRALPVDQSNRSHPLWWGMIMLVVIETTVFASLISSYFYLRYHAPRWPLDGIEPPDLLLPTISAGLMLASMLPAYWAQRSIRQGSTIKLQIALAIGFVLVAAALVLKYVEYADVPYLWTTNAYASVVWTITGFHSMHIVTLLLFTAVVQVLAFKGYFTAERHIGITANRIYWYFVALGWLPLYATMYLSPRLL